MTDFIRGLFEAALKTNNSLYFAVITGCLRISKESIFTGLNNLDINSILTVDYGEYFGFTEPEVMKMCRDYELEDKFQEMKNWYNGYLFGDTNVYNPWSCIKYIKTHVSKRDAYPEAYWVNTSSNAIVRDLIERADDSQKQVIEDLIAGVLTGMKGYIIKSNREGGNGRSDIFVYPIDKEEQAFVLEFEIASSIKELPQKAKEAVEQIIEREYEQELRDLGYINIKRYGIAFFSKNCLVISE